jgi:hypothetical protein
MSFSLERGESGRQLTARMVETMAKATTGWGRRDSGIGLDSFFGPIIEQPIGFVN